MIRVVIADDEPACLELLQKALEATGKVEIVGTANSGAECLQLWEEKSPDALFLDIKMGQPDGLEVATIVMASPKSTRLVFTTGHDDHAIQAFELHAMDYIVKTPDLKAFKLRIADTVQHLDQSLVAGAPAVAGMLDLLAELRQREPLSAARKLPVKDYKEGTVRLIDPQSIAFIERRDRRAIIYAQGQEFPTYFTMTQLEERLTAAGFFRVSPSVIVNLNLVEHLIPLGDGSYEVLLRLDAGQEPRNFDVSRNRARALFGSLSL